MFCKVTKFTHWRALWVSGESHSLGCYSCLTDAHRSGIEHLKARIAQLESQQAAQSAENQDTSPSTFHSHGWTSQEERAAPTNAVEYLSVAAMGEPEKRDEFIHGPSFVTMVQSITQLSLLLRPELQPGEVQDSNVTMSLESIGEDLRKRYGYGLRHLAESYHEAHHQLLPCVPPSTWEEIMDVATSLEQAAASGTTREPMLEVLLCFTACLGALNTSDYAASRTTIQYLAQHAARQVPRAINDASDLDAVCCLFLASLLSLHLFDTASSWNFAGLALTKALASGFHRASTETSETAEATSSLFWSLYTLDRAFAVVLDRPLSVEDGDMTIQLPLATILAPNGQSGIQLQSMSIWITHYSHMVSDWRRHLASDADLDTCMESLAYWRDTCREVEQRDVAAVCKASYIDARQLLLNSTESSLTCRALVQLFSRSLLGLVAPSLLSRINAEIEVEVPRFLSAYKAALDGHVLGPEILDVWAIVGSVVVFIASNQASLKAENAGTVRPVFGIGVAVMRVVSTSIDLLRTIALRCNAVLDLQDVLWAFLSALESSGGSQTSQQPGSSKSAQDLDSSISRCRLTIPQHLAKLMLLAITPVS